MDSVWLNGNLVPRNKAEVSVFDHGIVTGDGVFETIGIYGGIPLALPAHLERLQRSANGIGLRDIDLDRITVGVREVLRANECSDAKIRITVTGGESVLGSDRTDSPLTVIIATSPRTKLSGAAKVQVAPWPRNERGILAGLKTISYAENVAALAWAHGKGADEVIFTNTIGNLCEGSGSNIFIVIGGELYTPTLSSGALAGITRDLIVDNFDVKERDFPISVLYSNDLEECFLASSVREVQPISHVDGEPVHLSPGPMTMDISDRFSRIVLDELQKNKNHPR